MEPYCNLRGGSETALSHFFKAGFKLMGQSEVLLSALVICKEFPYFTMLL
jgi:hypothetical protein